ncbi:Dihydrolipoyllysine-residue succinyltransferase component of 2-oxoglutarate dehydrogenase complex [Candidatus Erwinia haradaeae]|uniref:Dihydrolipoyllysine-residue succinyltransferase n=1 Tax=Candidatus Erwinia haradaeae TaxID=1922217 RepID=A0A451DLX7_9GAMM|nr:dihydrolipoyllysine-residue succinyltransferase [Candidatus Erwinia haradaeae]VFP87746.1 Dihydrolipoyllysine-residue succinyltransferase component of 2-oxoglutarate dehydrogenase complex [Candidatus Erwinia haradaeae]
MNNIHIVVPDLPESVVDGTVTTWHKKIGDILKQDDVLVDIETDKVVLEIPAASDGVLEKILVTEGETVTSGQVLGLLGCTYDNTTPITSNDQKNKNISCEKGAVFQNTVNIQAIGPSMRRFISENDTEPAKIKEKDFSQNLIQSNIKRHASQTISAQDELIAEQTSTTATLIKRSEMRIPMSRLRARMAERLLKAKNTTAMLTTFNEVNMQSVISIRKEHGETFEKRHGVRLGFMSFYVKAVVEALKRYPEVNACIDGLEIVYHNYFDISIAISTPRGLVTPILSDANTLSMSDIEKKIKELSLKGRANKLTVEDLTGGTFTITNGGVFGSLMSTPLINPPQSAILGIHVIKDRPSALNGAVALLPMMYLALSYDHRLIDGRESVGCLATIKDCLEDPNRLLLDI